MAEIELWTRCLKAEKHGLDSVLNFFCECHGWSHDGLVRVSDGAIERMHKCANDIAASVDPELLGAHDYFEALLAAAVGGELDEKRFDREAAEDRWGEEQ